MSFLGLHPNGAAKLSAVIGFTYAFQAAWAAYAVPAQDERVYDIAGSLGFVSTTLLSLYYPTIRTYLSASTPAAPARAAARAGMTWNIVRTRHPRQLLASAMLLLWAGRLGSFLLQRVLHAGKDSRFDKIKTSPAKFSVAWFAQATWITAVSLPVLLINALPAAAHRPLGAWDALAFGVWAAGWGLEIVADRQKSAWRRARDSKKHEEQWISSGVWGWSRHPNYLGEITLQCGSALLALSALPAPSAAQGPPNKYWALATPLFTYLLLRYASGVPPLERSAEAKWGQDPRWRAYVRDVSVLVPWPGAAGKGRAA